MRRPLLIIQEAEVSEHLLSTGKLYSQDVQDPEFIAYLAHPSEIEPLVRQAGLELERLINVEGLAAQKEQLVNDASFRR